MLILFIMSLFVALHLQFLVRNIFFGADGAHYFSFYLPYPYSRDVAIETLLFSASCAVMFFIGYLLSKHLLVSKILKIRDNSKAIQVSPRAIHCLAASLGVQIAVSVYVLLNAGLNYQDITELKGYLGFIFELRMFALLLLSYVLINIPVSLWLSDKRLRFVRYLYISYILLAILLQARSVVFEAAAVPAFCYLMWTGNKVRLKYLALLAFSFVVPNLIVLIRLHVSLDSVDVFTDLFSLEYSVLLNNLLSHAIYSKNLPVWGATFFPSMILLIPSPLRDVLGITVVKSYLYVQESLEAGVTGGGFSLLAEMFMNFGWLSIFCFLLFGIYIGNVLRGASKVGRVGLYYASAPLVYIAFILCFRNDFGVFLKYVTQLLIATAILSLMLRARLGSRGSTQISQVTTAVEPEAKDDRS